MLTRYKNSHYDVR